MIHLGLTGNIATGKSTVARLLQQRGALVVDADQLSREVMAPGTPVFEAIVEAFGEAVVTPAGELDRPALARIVFADEARLRELERLVHPAVAALREEKLRSSTAAVAVLEAVKLVESGQHETCDELWVITASPDVQRRRLVKERGMSEEETDRRLAAQPPVADKLALADVVLENGGSLAQLEARVEAEWRRLFDAAS